jgi:hypothetical protein
MSTRHRMLRRGKVYGNELFDLMVLDRLQDTEGLKILRDLRGDAVPRGLHFFCVNASIKSQFEFVQQSWANNPHFNNLTNNSDPITGANGDATCPQSMSIPGVNLDLRTNPLPRFVTVKAGGYWFIPGFRALHYLASPKA